MADATLAQIGSETTLSYWNVAASPDAWASLGPIRTISGVGVERPEVESTTLDSTSVERIGGLRDGKEVTVTFTAATTSMLLIISFVDDGDPLDLKLTFPTPLNDSLYLTLTPLSYEFSEIGPSDLIEIELGGRITGDITDVATHP
jgi:hypothetical protein